MAFVVFVCSAALIFIPFDRLGVDKPIFAENYESQIVIAAIASAAVLSLELVSTIWRIIQWPYQRFRAKQARKKSSEKAFYSLNLNELCVCWAMTQQGVETVLAYYNSPVIVSMRHKGALRAVPGMGSLTELPHAMPEELYNLVKERGLSRFPDDFRNSPRFEDEVRRMYHDAIDW
ncbi:super-infection exclusion protein B [Pelagovum pacificum]|uniref:super-infection exclusion protein B n=1 Tax=Pelagovum pacificum TaxID=2588711 RepID=UPI0018CF4C91|nr:super-infection exclusion protein B [Pelagovum pacificum]QQA45106.1 super-infection exclusion protein B [Pelagovum pacificum]